MSPIERTEGGGTMITGTGIDVYRMIALKGAVKMEGLGIRFKGPSRTAEAKRLLGLPRSTKRETLIEQLQARAEELRRVDAGQPQTPPTVHN